MKILSAKQIKEIDALTLKRQHIKSIDLMERVATKCADLIYKKLEPSDKVVIFSGMSDNGGDGLAIARLLYGHNVAVKVVVVNHRKAFSTDAQINFDFIPKPLKNNLLQINTEEEVEKILLDEHTVLIDALLGTGVKNQMMGVLKAVCDKINNSPCKVISIDIPSGLLPDTSSVGFLDSCIYSNLVLTLQFPNLALLMPENKYVSPEFEIINIGLDEQAIDEQKTDYHYLEEVTISKLLKSRNKFSNKGNYGHALLYAGSSGKSGAAIISAEACLRSGAGLLTVHSTKHITEALVYRLPEAMTRIDENESYISSIESIKNYNALAFGPGVGIADETQQVLKSIIQLFQGKLIIDADGLTILSENKTWLEFLPKDTILTPHPKEFERLVGSFEDNFDRLTKAQDFAVKYGCILVLKDTHTHICMPDGSVVFNSVGNPGLAKGGSGDALTGIILGLLSRGYSSPVAAIIGVYIHGLSADLCVKEMSEESLLITDVINKLPYALKKLENKKYDIN